MKKAEFKDKNGFTLAELLIVVAIIAVLVAISIPIFSKQIQKARLATNQANARAAYAAVEAEYLTTSHRSKGETYYSYDTSTGQVKTIISFNDPEHYLGVDKDWTTPASWTTTTWIGGMSYTTPGQHVYKKWGLVVQNETGRVRQYLVSD